MSAVDGGDAIEKQATCLVEDEALDSGGQHGLQQVPADDDSNVRRASILGALDAVHRSLLLNNLKYECDKGAFFDPIETEPPVTASRPSKSPQSIQIKINISQSPVKQQPANMRNPSSGAERLPVKDNRHGSKHSNHSVVSSSSYTTHSTTRSRQSATTTQTTCSASCANDASNDDDDDSSAELNTSQSSQPAPRKTHRRRSNEQQHRRSDDQPPMLRIVQEMSEQRSIVVSTIEVNREKVRHWQQQESPEKSHDKLRRKSAESGGKRQQRSRHSRQRIISENFCNEFLDQNVHKNDDAAPEPADKFATVYTSSDEENHTQLNNTTLPVTAPELRQAPITFGKLEAASPRSARIRPKNAGRLMAKRLARHSLDSSRQSLPPSAEPPAKPPRTFSYTPSPTASSASSSVLNVAKGAAEQRHSALSSSNHTTATLRAEDGRAANNAKVVGWKCEEFAPERQRSHNHEAVAEFLRNEQFEAASQENANAGQSQPRKPSAIGWASPEMLAQKQQPQSPVPKSVGPMCHQPVGWTPPPKAAIKQQKQQYQVQAQQIPQQIVDMLYYDKHSGQAKPPVSIMTSTQRAVPQSPPREYIDDVDSPRAAAAMQRDLRSPAANNSQSAAANRQMERFANGTVCSTPQRHNNNNHARLDELRRAVEYEQQQQPTAPALADIESQILRAVQPSASAAGACQKCPTCAGNVPQPKRSFGKLALRRTKTFLVAGRHMLANRMSMQPSVIAAPPEQPQCHSADDLPFSDGDAAEADRWRSAAQRTPAKLETTVRKNQLNNQSNSKRTDKSMNFGRNDEVFSDGGVPLIVESPRRLYERFLASAAQQRTPPADNGQVPPKKPARLMQATKSPRPECTAQNNFDFQRKVASPKAGHRQTAAATSASSPSKTGVLSLLPKRLFGAAHSKSRATGGLNIAPVASPSYRSYQDGEDDGFNVFMGEYLRRMYEQIVVDQRARDEHEVPPSAQDVQPERHEDDIDEEEDEEDDARDFAQIRDGSSECSNGEDVGPERLQHEENMQPAAHEPLYTEINKTQQPKSPLYAVVNKRASGISTSATKSGGNLFSQSVESLCMLNNTDDHDLVHSIEDFLGAQFLAGLRPKVSTEFKDMQEVMSDRGATSSLRESKSVNDLDVVDGSTSPREADVVKATPGHERQSPAKCEELRQSAANPAVMATQPTPFNDEAEIYSDISSEPQFFRTAAEVHSTQSGSTNDRDDRGVNGQPADDNCSIGTYSSIVLTESICDEVLRGERINDDICATMQRLQGALNLTGDRRYAQAEPESSLDGGELSADELYDRQNCTAPPERGHRTNVPKYRQFADTVRNSIRSSSRFFKSNAARIPHRLPDQIAPPPAAIHRTSHLQALRDQVAHQCELRPQLLEATAICRSSAGLEGSGQLVEAERLLLLSHAKETAARCEMTRINYDERRSASGCAMVELRRLEIRLRQPPVFDMHHKFYYVCVCSYRQQVLATAAQLAEETDVGLATEAELAADRQLVFDGLTMRFVDMQQNFQLKIEVFMLRVPHYSAGAVSSKEASDASRFRSQDAAFATPANLWPISATTGTQHSAATRLRTHTRRYEFPQCTTVSASSCIFSGTSRQRLVPFVSGETQAAADGGGAQQPQRPMLRLSGRPLRVDFHSEIVLDIPELKGFLYVRRVGDAAEAEATSGGWSRQWCWIRGCKMFMSAAAKRADPQAAQRLGEKPEPPALRTIDLTHCVSDRLVLRPLAVGTYEPPYDFRQTVTVECLQDDPVHPSVQYMLAAEAAGELPVWVRELNRVLEFVRDWRL